MAAYNCCSIALSSLARSPVRYGIVSPNSVSQPRSDRRSFRTQMGFTTRKCAGPERVSCLADTKAEVVTGKSWEELVLKNNTTPVLVEFYASWCGPCRMVHRIIDEIATDYSGKINCFVLDAKNDPKVAEDYDIKAVPVVLLFKNGEKCESIIGTMPKEFYVAAIERVLDS